MIRIEAGMFNRCPNNDTLSGADFNYMMLAALPIAPSAKPPIHPLCSKIFIQIQPYSDGFRGITAVIITSPEIFEDTVLSYSDNSSKQMMVLTRYIKSMYIECYPHNSRCRIRLGLSAPLEALHAFLALVFYLWGTK